MYLFFFHSFDFQFYLNKHGEFDLSILLLYERTYSTIRNYYRQLTKYVDFLMRILYRNPLQHGFLLCAKGLVIRQTEITAYSYKLFQSPSAVWLNTSMSVHEQGISKS